MLHIRTPLILHPGLSSPARRIWLKLENLQPSGSFKLRGMGLLCSQAAAQGKTRVVCPSGGNAGFATAVAAVSLGLQACIVVPHTTPESTRARIRETGAEVIVHGKVWDEANQRAMELAQGRTPNMSRLSITRCCGKGTARWSMKSSKTARKSMRWSRRWAAAVCWRACSPG